MKETTKNAIMNPAQKKRTDRAVVVLLLKDLKKRYVIINSMDQLTMFGANSDSIRLLTKKARKISKYIDKAIIILKLATAD